MTEWNHDISTAPRDCDLWLATKCGKVTKSHWHDKFGSGRWVGLATREEPIAWQAYVVPAHPNSQSPEGVNPNMAGGLGANGGGDDVDGSAERASRQSNDVTHAAGAVEAGIDDSFVDGTASGPDDKQRAPLIIHKHIFLDDCGSGA